jgi:hypothetical protein
MLPIPLSTEYPVVMPATIDADYRLERNQAISNDLKSRAEEAKEKFEMTGEKRFQEFAERLEARVTEYTTADDKIRNTNRDVGHLWACSGFGQELDWSLMLAPHRVVQNGIPRSETLALLTREQYEPASTVNSYSSEDVKPGNFVVKKGRTTGVTVGVINYIRSTALDTINEQKVLFTGWHIAPADRDHSFSRPGDSGSWVLDMAGNWIGMLNAEFDGGALMLTVDRLVPDIERLTGARVGLP